MARSRMQGLRKKALFVIPATAFAVTAGLGVAQATIGDPQAKGHGANSFGKTIGTNVSSHGMFTYNHGYYCDTRVAAKSTTGCEVGEAAKIAKPAGGGDHIDPLYITVPLGFTEPMAMECPAKVPCVDHPDVYDLTRLAPVLAPIFKTTADKLSPALENFATPGHDHFIDDDNNGRPEWWNVEVIGVADPTVYAQIKAHHSLAYIRSLQKAKNPAVTADVPTNSFLYFSAS